MNRMRLKPHLLWAGLAGFATLSGWSFFQQRDLLQAQSKPPVSSPAIAPKPPAVKPKPAASQSKPPLKPGTNQSAPAAVADPVLVGAGDIADCTKSEDELTAQSIDKIPGTVFTAGDDAYPRGTAEDFQNCYEPTWGRFKARTFPVPGNHEYYSPNAEPYYAYFGAKAGVAGKGYYSYNLGKWHVVALNSNIDAQTGSEQEQWLKADLAAHPRACTLAYWHHPVFSSGVHGNDPKMQDIWQTLYRAGVDVVVNGHDHHYERFAPQNPDGKADPKRGIRQFVVGTGGAELRELATVRPNSEVQNTATYGVIKFVLSPKSYRWEFIPIQGQTFTDRGTQACVTS
ncbi:metallophosphoesterase family protein [Altericista sp. CCNU0014]|uniref:metallophosphoesterase family protein n=1 Tax=Altericista sp. CCNU0014 TaxID=3082949 RepID=UPI00384B4ECB